MPYLSVCAIHRGEVTALREWIEYHRIVGVEHFYLYNNDIDPHASNALLAPYVAQGLVDNISFPGNVRQIPAYNDCQQRFGAQSRWIAFIDLDEFIYPVASNTVSDLLRSYESYSALAVNWFCYGSSGHAKHQPSTIEAYRRRATDDFVVNQHVKCIVNPLHVRQWADPHVPKFRVGFAVNESLKRVNGPFSDNTGKYIRLNHYLVKSKEDCDAKIERGRSDISLPPNRGYWAANDKNDVYDSGLADRFVEEVKNRLSSRDIVPSAIRAPIPFVIPPQHVPNDPITSPPLPPPKNLRRGSRRKLKVRGMIVTRRFYR